MRKVIGGAFICLGAAPLRRLTALQLKPSRFTWLQPLQPRMPEYLARE